MSCKYKVLAAALPILALGSFAHAGTVIYSDNFDSGATDATNYNVYATPGASGPSSNATFGFDYSTQGIPSAPNSTGGTTIGLEVQVDDLQASTNPPNVLGALEVATKGLSLPTAYTVQVDVWGNYIGSGSSIATSGSNGTTAVGVTLQTAGTSLASPNANDGYISDTFHDGGNSATQDSDFRSYVYTTNEANTTGYYAAGTSSTAKDNSNSYYSFLPSVSAPTVQSTASATQGGSTPAGVVGFRWTTWTFTQDGTNISWYIQDYSPTTGLPVGANTLISTVPDSAFTTGFGGNQIALDAIDGGLTGNYTAPATTYNFDVFDNLVVTAVPEPTSLGMLGLGALALVKRTRRVSLAR